MRAGRATIAPPTLRPRGTRTPQLVCFLPTPGSAVASQRHERAEGSSSVRKRRVGAGTIRTLRGNARRRLHRNRAPAPARLEPARAIGRRRRASPRPAPPAEAYKLRSPFRYPRHRAERRRTSYTDSTTLKATARGCFRTPPRLPPRCPSWSTRKLRHHFRRCYRRNPAAPCRRSSAARGRQGGLGQAQDVGDARLRNRTTHVYDNIRSEAEVELGDFYAGAA